MELVNFQLIVTYTDGTVVNLGSIFGSGSSDDDDPETEEPAPDDDPAIQDGLPNVYFDGEELTILYYEDGVLTGGEMGVTEMTGNVINDAVFERNRAVEERMGVVMDRVEKENADAAFSDLRNCVMVGDDTFSMMVSSARDTYDFAVGGFCRDLNYFEYVDLSAPWWNQSYNDAVSYKGMQHTATGSMLLSLYRAANVMVFNRDEFADLLQDPPYDTVMNGEWTLDTLYALSYPLMRDNNINGEKDRYDSFGLVTGGTINVDAYWTSCGMDIIAKDSDGVPRYVLEGGEKNVARLMADILDLYASNGTFVFSNEDTDAEQRDIELMFADNKAAMATIRITSLESDLFRDMDGAYGILPMPKYSEEQKNYHTPVDSHVSVISVPISVRNPDMVGAVLTAMSSAGYATIKPVYESVILDDSSSDQAAMLELIMGGIRFDLGLIDPDNLCIDGLRASVAANSNNIGQYLTSIASTNKNSLADRISALESLLERSY
jgi:hypothetical protein